MSNAFGLADHRAAKVAKVKCSKPCPKTPDEIEEHWQQQFKAAETPASTEEIVFLVLALIGCVCLTGWFGMAAFTYFFH